MRYIHFGCCLFFLITSWRQKDSEAIYIGNIVTLCSSVHISTPPPLTEANLEYAGVTGIDCWGWRTFASLSQTWHMELDGDADRPDAGANRFAASPVPRGSLGSKPHVACVVNARAARGVHKAHGAARRAGRCGGQERGEERQKKSGFPKGLC